MYSVLLGITGHKHSGKHTVANILRSHGFNLRSFDQPIKETCQAIFMLSDDQLYDYDARETVDPRWGLSPRKLFKSVGTMFRECTSTHLPELKLETTVSCAHMKQWLDQHKPSDRLVISDVRFPDEEALIRKMGGKIVRIERIVDPHHINESEQDRILADYVLDNNSNLVDLAINVHRMISEMFPSLTSEVTSNVSLFYLPLETLQCAAPKIEYKDIKIVYEIYLYDMPRKGICLYQNKLYQFHIVADEDEDDDNSYFVVMQLPSHVIRNILQNPSPGSVHSENTYGPFKNIYKRSDWSKIPQEQVMWFSKYLPSEEDKDDTIRFIGWFMHM